jgi:mono/diheme cytochrome c family protein
MRTIKMLVATVSGSLSAVALLGGLLLTMHGVQASPPGKWEHRIVTWAKHSFLVRSKHLTNPLPATSENTAEGRQNFSHYCFVCHGLDGQNTGVPFADAMSPSVPSLATVEVQSYTDGQIYWVIKNGLWPSGMPASRGILTDEEIWSIVTYVRNLPRAGSLGDPPAFTGENCSADVEQVSPTGRSRETKGTPLTRTEQGSTTLRARTRRRID